MIVYFADRRLSILGLASTELESMVHIMDDKSVMDVDTGTTTLNLFLNYDQSGKKSAESMANAGNYILRKNSNGKSEFFTIIDFEEDVDGHQISIYAEDGGLDLLNDVADPFTAESAHTLEWYMERWLVNTGFEINLASFEDKTKELSLGWTSSSTITARLISIADAFDAEIDFGFDIEGLKLTHKYVNVYKKRGKDIGTKLRLNKELSNLRIKKTVANLATALEVYGAQDTTDIDLEGVGALLIGNDFAYGDGQSGNGWVDSFAQYSGCMGYAIRQLGGDFTAKGKEGSTYPNKNYAECLQDFMSTSGSQNKDISVDGPRGYKLMLSLSWALPTGTNNISLNYTLKLVAGSSYYFTNFKIGHEVKIGGTTVNSQARSSASYKSISRNGTLTLCSGTASIPQSDSDIAATALIDMAVNTIEGQPAAPGAMNLSGSFKVVKADTEDNRKTIKYVVVGGGINDVSSIRNSGGIAAIKTGIDNFINVCHQNFPYAKIYFVPLLGTIEGNIDDQSKPVKYTVVRNNYTEAQWLTYSTIGHEDSYNVDVSVITDVKKDEIFWVKGKSTDGGWTHTAVYVRDDDTTKLSGICVGHMVEEVDVLKDTWAGYARTKGVYTCDIATEWFQGEDDYRPESGSSMLLNSYGNSAAGQYIARFVGGWDGDVDSDDSGYGNTRYITLEGTEYDDGDFYIDGKLLKSRNAVSKWTRFVNNDTAYTDSYHLVREFSYDTDDKDELLTKAIAELKRLREVEVSYEADIVYLPPNVTVGDTVDIIDELGELYLSTRILSVEHSDTRDEDRIVFGEFTEKQSGISQIVRDLADQFKEQSNKQTFYTWTAYAEDNLGNGISLARQPSSMYLGIATYRLSPDVDLSDPGVFKWTVLEDSDAISISISSSNGTYFTDTTINTVLTAFVFVNGILLSTEEQIGQYGTIHWYKDGSLIMDGSVPYEGSTLTILESDLVDKGVYEARLEG